MICFVRCYEIMYALEVKDFWRPRFEAAHRKDPRLVLDHAVLSSDNDKK